MTTFGILRAKFRVSWTTVWVGWRGLGAISPWPDRWTDFPPLLSAGELAAYAGERRASASDQTEFDLEAALLDPQGEGREAIESVLNRLSDLDPADPALELRKWRVIRLQQVLETMPKDAVYGLIALTEFWQEFGFPPDSPHAVQGRGNSAAPDEYYQRENLDRLLSKHHAWISDEVEAIKKHEVQISPL